MLIHLEAVSYNISLREQHQQSYLWCMKRLFLIPTCWLLMFLPTTQSRRFSQMEIDIYFQTKIFVIDYYIMNIHFKLFTKNNENVELIWAFFFLPFQLLRYGPTFYRRELIGKLTGRVVALSLHVYGCRVIQKVKSERTL